MPSTSHAKCKVCRALIHRTNRFGLCPTHYQAHRHKLREDRRETKTRKQRALAAQLAAQIKSLEEEHSMSDPSIEQAVADNRPDTTRGGPKRVGLTAEQEVEIIDAYCKTNESTVSINARYGLNGTYLFNILNRVGITWRRKDQVSFDEWQASQQKKEPEAASEPEDGEIPSAQIVALENMLKLPTLPPKPEPVAPTPNVERRVRMSMQRWAVSVEGTLIVEAPDIAEALRLVQAQAKDLRITAINPA